MELIEPTTLEDFEKYFELRWRILRAPWKQLKGSEQDDEEDRSYHIMAMENEQLIGVARLQFPEQNIAQLRYMAVDRRYQNKGTGRKIVAHMEDIARKNNAERLILHARDNALVFYEKLGYIITEKSYLLFNSIQHYKMSKTL